MEPSAIDLPGIFSKARRKAPLLFLVIFLSAGCAYLIASFLPKRYRAHFAVSIYGNYFKNPVLGEFVPDVAESGEMRAQREALIRQALSNEFLDKIGEVRQIYHSAPDTRQRLIERQEFLERISIVGLNQTTFEVAFVSTSPEQALGVVDDALEQIRSTLSQERKENIVLLRDSIRGQLESLGLSMHRNQRPEPTMRAESLTVELTRVQAQLHALLLDYSESHPMVARLRARARELQDTARRTAAGGAEASASDGDANSSLSLAADSFNGAEPQEARLEVFRDLYKKFNYVSVAARMEQDRAATYLGVVEQPSMPAKAIFPNKAYFTVWGLMIGLLISTALVFSDGEMDESERTGRRKSFPAFDTLRTRPGPRPVTAVLESLVSGVASGGDE